MTFLITLISGFICFWSWGQLPKFSNKFQSFFPYVVAVILVFLKWEFLAGAAFVIFLIESWLRKIKYSTVVIQVAVLAMGFEFFIQKISLQVAAIEPEPWIFAIGDTGWQGLATGFLFAMLFRKLTRQDGHSWWYAPALILTGVGSLGFVWACFLGDRFGFRGIYRSIFSLVGVLGGLFLIADYQPHLKMTYWLIACLVWICAEVLVFHRQGKD